METQLGGHAADEAGRRLETEWRPVERALLVLKETGEIDLPDRPEVIPRGKAVDRRRGDREHGTLFELDPHVRSAAGEQRIGVSELHLSRGVVDRVIDVPRQQRVARVNALAALADLETVQ